GFRRQDVVGNGLRTSVGRRRALSALAAGAAAACGTSVTAPPAPRPPGETPAPATPAPTGESAPAPEITVAPAAAPLPRAPELAKLGPTGIVQPLFSNDGTRVLFYDQPAPGEGGTWSVDLA